jgi:hypothetical protein
MPVSEGRNQCETMLALVFPNYQTGWDATNDYSNQDLLDYTPDSTNSTKGVVTDKITVYKNGVLVYGVEPDGTTPSGDTTSTTTKDGDINADGNVTYIDLLLLKKHVLGIKSLSAKYKANADLNGDGSINVTDVLTLKDIIIN